MTTNANQTIPFMAFWKALNAAMEERGHEPVCFGDAKHFWAVATDQARQDRGRSLARRLKALVA